MASAIGDNVNYRRRPVGGNERTHLLVVGPCMTDMVRSLQRWTNLSAC